MPRKIRVSIISMLLIFSFCAVSVEAKPSEYDAIVKHLKTKYRAKKVEIPMLWLARLAVRVARPAGVKSFSVTMFENLRFKPETLDGEMQSALRDSMGAQWSPILRVRSAKDGSQIYMYMREAGEKSVKIMLVTIDRNQAAVVRAKINPEKLAEFVENPKIFGVSLGDDAPAPKTENATGEKLNN